jgi:hypothetical protein
MLPARYWWRRWLAWGLAACAADVLVIGFGMGVAGGVPFIGLALGLWAAWLAWRGAERREQVLPLSLWGGFVSAGIVAHFTFLGELGLFLLLGPQEIGRPILGELTGAGLGFLSGLVPPVMNSVGAFWVVQMLAFGTLELMCGLLGAWIGAKALLARDGRLARGIERAWERMPKGLEAGLIVGIAAVPLAALAFIASMGLPLAHLLLAAPLGALAGWLTQRWTGRSPAARGQLSLAGLLAGLLTALGAVAIFALFTVVGPAGRTTLSASYADVADISRVVPAWLDPLVVAVPLLSVLFILTMAGLAVGGSQSVSNWARRRTTENSSR